MTGNPETPPDDTKGPATDSAEASPSVTMAVTDIPLEKMRDEDVGDENPDDVIRANPQWGSVSMLANAASFDTVVPGAMAAAFSNMFWNVERNGQFSLSNGGGTLQETFLQMFGILDENGRKKEDADDDGWDSYTETHERGAEAKRQIEEQWASSRHEFAGQDLTGDEWQAMKTWFNDPESVASWEQAMMAETGQSLAEVRRTGGKMRRFYELMEKQSQGKPLSRDEQAEWNRLNDDPDVRTGVQIQQRRMEAERGLSSKAEVKAQTAETKSESVVEGSNLIAARANLNAEPLTPTYNAAATDRTTAAPDPMQPSPEIKPVELAVATPQPRPAAVMNANLDMG